MAAPVLATKLYIPPPPSKIVVRSRLIERLNEGLQRTPNVTLISAPAGFGKTTLVSEWVSGAERPTAWIALDENDNDPVRFLIYLIHAIQKISPDFGAEILPVLHVSQTQPPPIEAILTALLNEITTITDAPSTRPVGQSGQGFILVLDDYHMIDSKSVDDALTFLIEHLPPQMHLVITTREDPALPIPRLRARGQLTELRAADLRFTPSEATEFLNQVMGLNLSADDVAALESRTEGWIAGLQLAALSMRNQEDIPGFVQAFTGDHRYIVDYLVEEVLQRQTQSVRNFLLQTSILDRLNGPLCDAVTNQAGGNARLEALQRGNFFLVPLDDRRHWYRYHHLFADVLRMHLMAEQPELAPALHQRASVWYEQNGSPQEAIRHALAAADFERAADLIELAAPAMLKRREEATVLAWMQALPEELFRDRPVLSVLYVGTVMSNGGIEGVEARLQDAERWLDIIDKGHEPPGETANRPEQSRRMVVLNEEEFRRLPGMIAMYRAGLALAQGDVPETVRYARQVLELVPEQEHLVRGAAAALLGLALWRDGDLETAHKSFAGGMAHLQKAGHISDAVGGVLALADIRITQGRLRDAMRTYEGALQLATQHGTPGVAMRGTADMYAGMSELAREYNDLPAAAQHLSKSQEQGEHTGFPQHPYRWRVALARLREARGDLDGALELLQEAEPLYASDFFPNVRPVAALKARVWLAQGRLEEALGWAREQGLSAEDELSYLREFEHMTLARLLLARYKKDREDRLLYDAVRLLERLQNAAGAGGRIGHLIEILALQALAHRMQGDLPKALASLERALTLAEPEGYIHIFLDEGADMEQLLREADTREIMPGYTDKLLSAFEAEGPTTAASTGEAPLPAIENRKSTTLAPGAHRSPAPHSTSVRGVRTAPGSAGVENLAEPLTERELEVLRLFKTELSGPEIARELVVGLSTIRTHTKNIYSKLNVNSRRAAVKRGIELGLI